MSAQLMLTENAVVGCWRLLPTTGPYMLKDIFSHLLWGKPAPEQPDVWEISRFAIAGGEAERSAYREWKAASAERLLDRARRLWGGATQGINTVATGSPATFRDELGTCGGGVYGVEHSMEQITPGARTRLPGLWLGGQGTLMCGLVGASLSALVTVGDMVGLEPLWDEVRRCR